MKGDLKHSSQHYRTLALVGISDLYGKKQSDTIGPRSVDDVMTMNLKRFDLHMLSTRFHSWRYVLYPEILFS